MNPYALRDGSAWFIREAALRAYGSRARQDLAGLVPGLSPSQPPPYPMRAEGWKGYDRLDGVAMIKAHGLIYRHSRFLDDLYAWALGGVSVDSLADSLRNALADPDVRSILFTFDSPGGQAAGIGALAAEIRAADAVKPVCAYCENYCCSAAYYLASAAGEVWADPNAFIGSIGVVLCLVDDRAFQEAVGIKEIPVVSSQSPDKWADPTTPEGLAVYQEHVDDLAKVFVADVAKYRGLTPAQVLSDFGRGADMIASKALKAGMVDKVGTVKEALAKFSGPYRNRTPTRRQAAASPTQAAPLRVRLVTPRNRSR